MSEKQHLIHHLEELLCAVRESESAEDAYRLLRRQRLFYPLFPEKIEYRLDRIERSLDRLTDRPAAACRFASDEGESIMQLMTGQGINERQRGISYLSDWMNSPTKLTIADPYLIKNSGLISEADYKNSLESLLPRSLTTLELFVGPRNSKYQKSSIATWFNVLCQARGIALSVFHQEQVHDRVWLKNENDAIVVGTSFNGLGNKCAFLLKLDTTDTMAFSAELERIRSTVSSSNEV